jgi:hypothetical protein
MEVKRDPSVDLSVNQEENMEDPLYQWIFECFDGVVLMVVGRTSAM